MFGTHIYCSRGKAYTWNAATLTRPISWRAAQQSEMSVSIFRSGVPVCRYIDNISVDWYPRGLEYSTGLGWQRVGRRARMIFVFYALSRALHFTRFLYGGEPVALIDGIEAHSYRITHAFHLRSQSISYSGYVTAIWRFLLPFVLRFSFLFNWYIYIYIYICV